MIDRLPPVGFWSYARQDDEMSGGKLSALRFQLKSELQQQYGRERINIFQDVGAIPPGAEWETEIVAALNRSTFFIPLVTPAFLQSEFCCREVEIFFEREKDLARDYSGVQKLRRVFPILYVSVDGVEPEKPTVLHELQRLQWADFRELRHKDPHDHSVRVALERLASGIRTLLMQRGPTSVQVPRAAPAAARDRDDAVSAPRASDRVVARKRPSNGVIAGGAVAALACVGVGVMLSHAEKGSSGRSDGPAAASDSPSQGIVGSAPAQASIKVIKEGQGAHPTLTDVVLVNYSLSLADGKVVDKGEQVPLPLDTAVTGLSGAALQMRKGGRYRVTVPPSLGYGEKGDGPIPGNATLTFDIELLDFVSKDQASTAAASAAIEAAADQLEQAR